jgi:hypothetical protein
VSGSRLLSLKALDSHFARLGKGESMKSIMSDRSEVAEGKYKRFEFGLMSIAYCSMLSQLEGIFTSPAAAKWAEKLQLDLPIIQTVAKVQQLLTLQNNFHFVIFVCLGHTRASHCSGGNNGSFCLFVLRLECIFVNCEV